MDGRRTGLIIDTDESWTDAESLASCPRAEYVAQLRNVALELELIRVNVQMLLDRVLSMGEVVPPCNHAR
jgi:hypothetical protein